MARIVTLPRNSVPATAVNPDTRIALSYNTKLSEKQTAGGLQCKVQLTHPAFSAVFDIWKNKAGKLYITDVSQKSTGKDSNRWFALCALSQEAKDYILYDFVHRDEKKGIWYLDALGEKVTHITNEDTNPDLGIVKITPVGNMTDNQLANDMLCKVNIETTVGTLYQYTIWKSKFGEMVYGRSPKTNPDDSNNTAYLLSKECQAQVLSFIHPLVDFTAEPDVDKEALAKAIAEQKKAIDEASTEGFQPVGDSMFGTEE